MLDTHNVILDAAGEIIPWTSNPDDGYDRVMFETDFPHPTSIYPGIQERAVESIGHLDYEKRKMILSTNAATLFNLDI